MGLPSRNLDPRIIWWFFCERKHSLQLQKEYITWLDLKAHVYSPTYRFNPLTHWRITLWHGYLDVKLLCKNQTRFWSYAWWMMLSQKKGEERHILPGKPMTFLLKFPVREENIDWLFITISLSSPLFTKHTKFKNRLFVQNTHLYIFYGSRQHCADRVLYHVISRVFFKFLNPPQGMEFNLCPVNTSDVTILSYVFILWVFLCCHFWGSNFFSPSGVELFCSTLLLKMARNNN